MPFCTNCGKPLSTDARFCTNCGNAVKATEAARPSQQTTKLPQESREITSGKQIQDSAPGFLAKYKAGIIAGAITLLLIIAVYFIFFRPNPEKEGQLIAAMVCSCREDSAKFGIRTLREFKDSFDKKQFKLRLIATDFLRSIYSDTRDRFDSCQNAAMKKYAQKGKLFSGNKSKYRQFELAFNAKRSLCNIPVNVELASLQNEISRKINALSGPEPGIEKIKSDLLGKKMIGWNFDFLSEFQQCQITNKVNAGNRIDLDLALTLHDESKNTVHDASVTVVYTLDNGEWKLNDVISHYITYTYRITTEGWQSVNMFPDTRCTITGNRFWVKDGENGQTYKGGGTDSDNYNLSGPVFYLWSRETGPVDLVVTFYPK